MDIQRSGFSAAQAFHAASVTRGEVSEWYKRGWLHIPPENPADRAARRYSLANIVEMFLFKSLAVSERLIVQHETAADLIGQRLERARKNARVSSLADLNRLDRFRKTEFFMPAHDGIGEGYIYWFITATGKGGAIHSNWDSSDATFAEMAQEGIAHSGKMLVFPLSVWLHTLGSRLGGWEPFVE